MPTILQGLNPLLTTIDGDDTERLQLALDTGQLYQLFAYESHPYRISKRLRWSKNNSGFVCIGARAKIILKTGTGQFDGATNQTSWTDHNVAFFADGIDRPVLKNVLIELEANAAVRSCAAAVFNNCTRADVDIETTGFKEVNGKGILQYNSCFDCTFKNFAYDCVPNSTSLASMQISCIDGDDNRTRDINGLNPINSARNFVGWKSDNVKLGSTAAAFYGQQSDGFNLHSDGAHDAQTVFDGWSRGCGEALDLQTSGCTGRVVAIDCPLDAVKIIYGASRNEIHAYVIGGGRSAVAFYDNATGVADRSNVQSEDNVVHLHAVDVASGSSSNERAAVTFGSNSGDLKPKNNTVIGYAQGSANMRNVVYSVNVDTGNIFEGDGRDNWSAFYLNGAGTAVQIVRRSTLLDAASGLTATGAQTITNTQAGAVGVGLHVINADNTVGTEARIDLTPSTAGAGVRGGFISSVQEGANATHVAIGSNGGAGIAPVEKLRVRNGVFTPNAPGTDKGNDTSNVIDSYATTFRVGNGSRKWNSGTGSPEGAVTGSPGDLFTRTDGGVGTCLYVKESGTGNTGWAAK